MRTVKFISVAVIISLMGCSSKMQKTVKIGAQVWMTKNLDVSTFRNGDPILEAKSNEEWVKAGEEGKPAWCYYENNPSNGAIYGKLYNWFAVTDPRGLAPMGWHIASDNEWTALKDNLSKSENAGGQLKSTSGWKEEGNGSNSSGFSALPGGYRIDTGGFTLLGSFAPFWCSNEFDTGRAWHRSLIHRSSDIIRVSYDKRAGAAVRCVKD